MTLYLISAENSEKNNTVVFSTTNKTLAYDYFNKWKYMYRKMQILEVDAKEVEIKND